MSSEKECYLGGYIELPKDIDWWQMTEDLDIVDEFIRISDLNVCISNSRSCNALTDQEYMKLDLNTKLLNNYKRLFEIEYSETLKKLAIHFGNEIEVKVGILTYWH